MQLVFSIIFLILALISWIAVVAYIPFGTPLGLLFLSFSIWLFAGWRYKKSISFDIGGWLLLLPILGFLQLMTANRNFGLANLFIGDTQIGVQGPWWAVFPGIFDAFVLQLFWWGVLVWVVIHFFRQVRKI